ncbi:MAG: glutamyl-tRNA reductase [Bacteroidota bacterium]|jgi:glutamyl-tRNA reductase|nr:MAG: glutamyl-tRNA reductase [Bacteroidota bacterium]
MQENFRALILTYKMAPVEVREQVSLNEEGVKKLLTFAQSYTSASDVLVVSTCNRTEIYYQSEKDHRAEFLNGLKLIKGIPVEEADGYFVDLKGEAAIRHLFEVAIGLDAQIIGDLQVSGQVKSAYQWSADMNMAGPFLHRLMHTIFFTNKRVVQETTFRDGAASLSYATTEMIQELAGGNRRAKILVLGVGEIGQDVVRNLIDQDFDPQQVVVLNRTPDKARKLAEQGGFRYGGLDKLAEEVRQADIVVSSVSGTSPLITADLLGGSLLSHKFFIDLSVPRSVDPALENIPGVVLYNLDEITEKTQEAVNRRRAAIPRVQEIIQEALEEFEDWAREMIVSPTIQKLKNTLEQIRREELARYLKNATPAEAARLDEMSRSFMQKILKYPVLHLKAACRRGDSESISELLHDLFNLERVREKKP